MANLQSYWQSVYHNADLSPPPDDSLVTLAASLSRLSSKSLALEADGNGCFVQPGNILEVTSYHSNDNYKVHLMILLWILVLK
jgi:hypothetical protein